jgi:hypothetical protein
MGRRAALELYFDQAAVDELLRPRSVASRCDLGRRSEKGANRLVGPHLDLDVLLEGSILIAAIAGVLVARKSISGDYLIEFLEKKDLAVIGPRDLRQVESRSELHRGEAVWIREACRFLY